VLGLLHLLILPRSGTDLAAQQARATFARAHPLTPVDLSWYGGIHPYGYSVLSPYVMAVLGVGLTGLIAAVAGAVLLARLLRETPHPTAGAYSGAVFCVADVVSGRVTFALGAAVALAALMVLPRIVPAMVLGALTGLFSPVAAAFLGLVAAVLVLRRKPCGWRLGLATATPVAFLGWLFPSGGIQPYEVYSAPYAVVAGLLLGLLTHSWSIRVGALMYALASAFLLLSPDPFGSNILRLGLLLAAPLVLASATEHWRIVVPIAALLAYWQLQPPYADLRAKPPPPFAAVTKELKALDVKRVEVVPLRDHGEAAHIAKVIPLARGWSRQVDTGRNLLFYRGALSSGEYHQWLIDNAVDAVALAPNDKADRAGRGERALLLVGRVEDLQRVWSDKHWVVWQFKRPPAKPIASPPVEVLRTGRTTITLRSSSKAYVDLVVRWSRWLSVHGPACLEKHESWTRIRFSGPGTAVVGSQLSFRPLGHCKP
jgi:MFS family permease